MLKTKTLALAIGFLALTACQEKSKTPPDDDLAARLTSKASGCTGSFYDCAMGLLASSSLSDSEKQSLSGCDFAIAKPTSSPVDVFEVSKQAVKHSCE